MSVSSFLGVVGVIGVLFGIGFLFAPNAILSMYGNSASDGLFVHICRLLGAGYLGAGVTAWVARSARTSLHPVLAGAAVGNVAALLATLYRQLNGGTTPGWINVVIFGFVAAGACYFLSSRGSTALQRA